MLVVLPPSETKVSGGAPGSQLDLGGLGTPGLNPLRERLLSALVELSNDPERAMKALKLGPKGAHEVERNREVCSTPVLPALERYTGVVYDAVGVTAWSDADWDYASTHVAVFSALFGLLQARDLIPAYRLSCDSRLDIGRLPALYAPYQEALWGSVSDFVVDLRSEGYRSLAPLPTESGVFVALVKPGPRGQRKALGHQNKPVKGRLVADLVGTRADIASLAELVAWGVVHGWNFDPESFHEGVIDLIVDI